MRPTALLLTALALSTSLAAAGPGYHLAREVAIGGEGGWDYVYVDPAAHRLYVPHATKVVVADSRTGAIVGEVTGTAGVHGVAIAPALGRGFTSNGRANASTIFDLATLKAIGTVPTGANPDSIRYLKSRGEVWTFNHSGGSITAFEAATGTVVATIAVGGVLEEAVEDPAAHRVYVNVEDTGALAVVDTQTHALVATWPMAGCEGPTALALDAAHHRLLSACEGRMAVTDSASGRAVTSFPIAGGVDGNGFDPATGLAFASSGTGVLTIAHQDTPDTYSVVQTVATQPSGRTMWLDPATHEVYVPVGTMAKGSDGRSRVVPGSMKVLVLAPGP